MKNALKKARSNPKNALQEFLMQYRRTPLSSGYSPSELLQGRQIRARIDVLITTPTRDLQAQVNLASRARLHAEVTDFRQDATERRARGGVCSLDA